jgi:hypothetical protein
MPKRNPGAISMGHLLPILITAALLVGVLVMKERCGSAAGNLFKVLDQQNPSADAGRP